MLFNIDNPIIQFLLISVASFVVCYASYRWGKVTAKAEMNKLLRDVMNENRKLEDYTEWCAQCFKEFTNRLKDM